MPSTLTEAQVLALAPGDVIADEDGFACVITAITGPTRLGNNLIRRVTTKAPYGGWGCTIGLHTTAARVRFTQKDAA